MYTTELKLPPEAIENPYKHLPHWGAMEQLEAGRRRLYEDAGSPLNGWVERGLFLVVAGLSIEFLREIKELEIKFFALKSWSEDKRFFLEHGLLLANEKTAIKVTGSFAFLSSELKRAVAPPAEFCSSVARILAN